MLKKTYAVFDRIRIITIIGILIFIIGLGTIQIVFRYFSNLGFRPFSWGDEVIRLSSLWVSFLSASIAAKEGAHLNITFLIEKYFPKRAMKIIKKAANLVVVATLCYLIYYGILRTVDNINASLQNLNVSMALFYASIPVGCFYLFVDYLLILIYGEHPFSKRGGNISQNTNPHKISSSIS